MPAKGKPTKFVQYDLGGVWRMSEDLAYRIIDAGYDPDTIIGLARGGWILARLMADRFAEPYIADEMKRDDEGKLEKTERKVVKVKHPNLLNIGVKHYGEYSIEGADFYQGLEKTDKVKNDINGKDVLIVDDVYDTGITLVDVLKYLGDQGFHPKTVKFAVLDFKLEPFISPHATEREARKRRAIRKYADDRIVPRLFSYNTLNNKKIDKWVIYPWDSREETMRALIAFDEDKWGTIGATDPEDVNIRRDVRSAKEQVRRLEEKRKKS